MSERRYLLTEDEMFKMTELCSCLSLAIEKIILNSQLPRVYDWKHPAIDGYQEMIEAELSREGPIPQLDDIF